MRDILQHLASALLTPLGIALHICPTPSPGPSWLACERWQDVPGGPALLLWFGSVHVIIDRGERPAT